MVETKVRPQEINLAVTSAELVPSFVGLPWWDNSVKILKFDTSGNGIPTQFVTALPQHTLTGEHGPKVTITQTAADNALIVNQVGAATAVSLVCGSTNSGRALDISQAAAQNAVNITKSHTGSGHALNLNNSGIGHALNIDNSGSGSGINLLNNSVGVGINIQQSSNAQALFIQQVGNERGLHIIQNSAESAIHVTGSFGNSSAAGLLFEKLAPVDTDIQIKFRRSDGAGDPDVNLTYWGQSNINTLGLTPDTGAGLHVTTNGRVVVGDFAVSNFTSGTGKFVVMDGYAGVGTTSPSARLHVIQTLADPAVVITQSANSNALNVSRSHTGSGGDAVNIHNDGSGTCLDLEQANASGATLSIDHSSSSSALVITKFNTNSTNPIISIQNNAASAAALDVRGHSGNWSVTKGGSATFSSINVNGTIATNQVTSTFSGGGVASANISLPTGTWTLRVDLFFHQSAWSPATFVIDGTTVQTTDNLGDQSGTGYTIMFGVKVVSGGTRTATVTTSPGSVFGAGPQARWLFMAWKQA